MTDHVKGETTDTRSGASGIDTSKPHSARMYDYFLGGKDNYEVDQEAAEKVISVFPHVSEMARTNRRFMHRATRLLAERGVRQFLDIGTGIPTQPNLHQVVQKITPDARVVYADNDPIVLRHAEALLHSTREGSTNYVHADVREPEKIIEAARETLDFDQPIALSLVALLHLVGDEDDPHRIVTELLRPLAPGSYLALSHATGDFDPETWERIVQIYRSGGTSAQVRSRTEFATFFDGLELVDPGVELAMLWHPELGEPDSHEERIPLYAGVARKV
ncbi:SAM-dependent methyltransferase [Streptomyces sp. BV286]|uniref:SAM-dependent methyltransferase n=1 Tax=unclassified Streptomyces TaxID=2593676 RepID=UPI001C2E0438|nr:SAM-dependent methyltransferase [Streptomyces sp. BV286]MBV1938550.1 SAM-dependent methyltransferase [Streptomyces sp. BV286]